MAVQGDDFRRVWQSVVKAIEEALPRYDRVNQAITLGLAERTRRLAVDSSSLGDGMSVLDLGIGPGNVSKLVLSRSKPEALVGLDVSHLMLRASARSLRGERVHLVRGVFEHLPFKGEVFDRIYSAFALRDAFEKT